MGKWPAVACEYQLMNRCIAGAMKLFAIYIDFGPVSKQCKNVAALGFPTGPFLNRSERLPISSNRDENYYRCQQMLNVQYIKMSINGASTICGFVSMIIE